MITALQTSSPEKIPPAPEPDYEWAEFNLPPGFVAGNAGAQAPAEAP